jgi:Carboxypeptidase regulatory-like domain/TonB-dependent Receptor Plug Domain
MGSYRVVASLFVALLGSSAALAQNASVSGTVTDPSGAFIVGATVTAINVGTGSSSPATTNQSGVYVFPSLAPGTYNFTSEHPGFNKQSVTGVVLDIGAQVTVNVALQIGQATQTVEVEATAALVNTSSATLGDVVTGKQLQDLPLIGRSAYNLITTQPGVIGATNTNFYLNGNQGNSINFTMDGINAQNNLLTGTFYLYSNFVSQDRTEEARIVTSPADAEYGRGAGQVQMITRGGSNRFVGSAWEEFRNTDLNANDFFNNQRGVNPTTGALISPRPILIQNNYGIRFGGPLKRNKTFFNGIYDPYKQRQAPTFTADVYTQSARNGVFRYYPGVLNGNAQSANPTVNLSGAPVTPAGATGPLQSISVFGVDPNRLVADPTGLVAKNLALMPLPNNFQVGDGLNVAGYTWNRPVPVNFQLYEGRIDHLFNEKHRISLTLNQQSYHSINVAAPPPYPSVPWQADPTETTQYSVALTSVLNPTLINELRIGIFRPRTTVQTPFTQTPTIGPVNNKGILPVVDGVPFNLCYSGSVAAPTSTTCTSPAATLGATNPISGNASNYIAPVYQYGDSVTWIKGRHSFKTGIEFRLISDAGFDANGVTPNVVLGANGAVPVTGISGFPGIGSNLALAQNLLTDLSGSVVSANMTNFSSGGANPAFTPGLTRYREWHQNEMSWYFKDDFKLRPNLTLNLGIRYELYNAPFEAQGKGLIPVNGVFGVSGTTFANGLFQPGVFNGSPTTIENIGPGSPNPNGVFYKTDRNNFAPAVGFAWALPGEHLHWLTGGKDQTSIRAGYGIGYQRLPIYLTHFNSGFEPGLAEGDTETTATNLSNLVLPVAPVSVPLAPIPSVGPGSHTQSLLAFDPNLRVPYVQNYNFSIQRAVSKNTSFTASFVGSKGTKLIRSVDTNEVNIYSNSFLQAFQTVQAGGDSPLIDKFFANLPVASAAAAITAAGNGSNYIRTNSSFFTFLANNNPGGLANALNTTTFGTNLVGGLVPHAGLPSNFFVANPQFLSTFLTGNFGNSTYNSLQLQGTRRFSGGFLLQGSYVWSKALGEDEGDSSTYQSDYRTVRDMALDKRLLSFDHRQVFKLNGIYELPVGRGRMLGRSMNAILDGVIGGWQVGWNYNYYTGSPMTITAQNTINNFLNPNGVSVASPGYTPELVGQLPGTSVTKLGGYVTIFPTLTQIVDPSRATLTTSGALNTRSSLLAIANAAGSPILVNPAAGQLGNYPLGTLTAPPGNQLDLNVQKQFRISERFNFQLRATATNALNHTEFAAPTVGNLNIDSTTFGRITTTAPGTDRVLVLQGRLNF